MSAHQGGAIVLVDPIATGVPFLKEARRRECEAIAVVTVPHEMFERLGGEQVRRQADRVVFAQSAREVLAALGPRASAVQAVIPTTEPGVDLAEALAAQLSLRGNTELPGARRDKALMREAAHAAGLLIPRFRRCATWDDVAEFARDEPLPLVVKTPRGAGTCHVYVCRDAAALRMAFERCLASKDPFGHRPAFVVVEEYIAGSEVAVNVFAAAGQIRVFDVWSYQKVEVNGGGPIYLSTAQRDASDPALEPVVEYALDVCRALRITHGPAHVEIKVDARGPVLIEVGARMFGARIPELWHRFSGVDPFEATVAAFLGELAEPPSPRFERRLAVAFAPVWHDLERVHDVLGLPLIQRLRSYVMHHVIARVGEPFERTRDLETVAATVWLAHADEATLHGDIEEVHRAFELEGTFAAYEEE